MTLKASLVALALFANSLVSAAPIEKEVTSNSLTKRDLPSFSHFEGQDARRQQVETGFRDAITLAQEVLNAPRFDETYNTYFDGAGNKDEILNVFRNIVGDNTDGTGASMIGKITVEYNDAANNCKNTGSTVVAAYTQNAKSADSARIVLCEPAYKFSSLADKSCDGLKSTVSAGMSSLGGIILHELTHFKQIGNKALGEDILDRGAEGYGPLNVRTLRSNDAGVARVNADNYRWYAQEEVYWSNKCGKLFSGPRDNRDTADDACGGQICQIM